MRSPIRLIVLAVAASCLLSVVEAQDRRDARVILISVDGLMPSSYTSHGVQAPNLRALARDGVWAEGVIGVLPSVTYPSHTTLITGVVPAVHGIVDNRILDPEGRSDGAWFYYSRDIRAPTLPMAARARGLRAAAVSWPVTVGMDLDYLVPEYFRNDHEDNLSMLRVLSSPRTLLEMVENARGMPFGWPQTDRDRTDIAKFIIATFDPHVLLLHLIDLDGAQHSFGPGSMEAAKTLSLVDAFVGEIISVAKASGRGDRTNIAVVSDHGFLPLRTMLQPNAALKREGLLKVDDRGRVVEWQAYFHSSGGSGYVYVKNPALEDRVKQLLETLKQDPANGIRSLWTRADLEAKGSHPDAAFGLDMIDGFYTGQDHDVLVKPPSSRGGHGFDPERAALHASFIMAGPDVHARGSAGMIKMTQIAPTLASILRVGLSTAAARPLDLRASPPPNRTQ